LKFEAETAYLGFFSGKLLAAKKLFYGIFDGFEKSPNSILALGYAASFASS